MKEVLVKVNLNDLISCIYRQYEENIAYRLIRELGSCSSSPNWHYIPSNQHQIVSLIQSILHDHASDSLKDLKFIDIGCGVPVIGDILYYIGFRMSNIHGLEYNKDIISVIRYGKDIFKKEDLMTNIKYGDLMSYDFKNFDILYSYQPIKSSNKMIQGIENIINTMKVGAKFYFNDAGTDSDKLLELGFEYIRGTSIWTYTKEAKPFKHL